MKDEKLKIGIKEIKEIKMTALEKERILKSVIHSPVSYEQPIKSPWTIFSLFSVIHKNRLVYYGFVFSLAVVLGGGAVFASGNSLPGNVFYPLKVSIVEPIHSAFTFSPKKKAQYESNLATKRMIEAETLKSQGKLDKAKEERLSLLLEDHTKAFNKAIEGNDDDDDAITNFQAGLNAHARVLELMNERDDKSEKQEKNNKVSDTARAGADKIKDTLKEREDNNKEKNEDKNEERKKHVREIIDGTVRELDNHTSVDVSPDRQTIIDNTHKTLEEANRYLKEADEEDEKGDAKEAYFRLLDSESSAKEAGIFLKSGLKFKDREKEEEKRNEDQEEKD
ncbi:MAG: Ran-binding protein [Parcubacteria group bacterium GW2011_GWF1_40_6]|uniref:Ran-binding protein n=2 Tax=Candidatus Nomuraibacteriota TaxID=1752729 RepID=A0A0G0TYU8_9BACT|nr:MAG: Ran-binding protein [Candidatus Nomurabacteria bacterium GW2011_GWF2_40_12]KKR67792.1 MAG: Ran-binding protein [Parcubacteria group bacterium GW2011_GWF1_40_6]OGJ09102.1 MAG: hypothetical protein A2356_01860 [Candidatus Nomurabacteria bacterium RIFOXYB1_FULL_39_16]OGJ14700.1 MAG: hypothetical protein A2585_02555 [Candidatus Nomurabacteria bacterium RIFOXYD1_FULL_39_12]